MSQMSQFDFPMLEIKDISLYLRELNNDIDVTENDFHHPQRERWQKFYLVILCECCFDLTPDSLCQIGSITADISYQELYEDSLPLFNLLKAMQRLLTTCEVDDFNMQDILNPKPKRLRKICSGLINFKRFQEERISVYEDMMRENEALQDQRESLVKESEELKMRINTLKSVRAEKEPEIKMIQDAICEEEQLMEALQKRAAVCQRDTSNLKTNIAEQKVAIARTKEELSHHREEDGRLSSQIVPSPDRLRGEMARMEVAVREATAAKEDRKARLQELRARRHRQAKRDTECDQAIRLMEAIQEQKDKERKLVETMSADKEAVGSSRDAMKSQDAQVRELNLQLSMVKEKVEKSAMIHNGKLQEMRATVDHLHQEKDQCGAQQKANQKAVRSIVNETEFICTDIQREHRKHASVMKAMGDKYQEILKHLDTYHSRLGEAHEKMRETI